MKFIKTLVCASILFGFTAHAQFKNKQGGTSYSTPATTSWSSFGGQSNEFDVNISQAHLRSYKEGNNNFTEVNLLGSYHHMLQSQIQVGAEGGLLSYQDNTSMKTLLALMGTFTYNLDYDLTNAFYGQAGLGLYPAYDKTNGKYESKFSFMFDFGKRISLWTHVSYKPYLRLMKRGDMDMEFMLNALNFSFFW